MTTSEGTALSIAPATDDQAANTWLILTYDNMNVRTAVLINAADDSLDVSSSMERYV